METNTLLGILIAICYCGFGFQVASSPAVLKSSEISRSPTPKIIAFLFWWFVGIVLVFFHED